MANRKNQEELAVLESLNIDFSGACPQGRMILYRGLIDYKLPLADFLRHTRFCAECLAVVEKHMPKIGVMDLAALVKGVTS